MTLNIRTLSLPALRVMYLIVTPSTYNTQGNVMLSVAFFIVMLRNIMLNFVMLSVFVLSVLMPYR